MSSPATRTIAGPPQESLSLSDEDSFWDSLADPPFAVDHPKGTLILEAADAEDLGLSIEDYNSIRRLGDPLPESPQKPEIFGLNPLLSHNKRLPPPPAKRITEKIKHKGL